MAVDRSLIEGGSIIEDSDLRMKRRKLFIKSFAQDIFTAHGHYVFITCESQCPSVERTRINLARIHTDGKDRKSGFSLVPSPDTERR